MNVRVQNALLLFCFLYFSGGLFADGNQDLAQNVQEITTLENHLNELTTKKALFRRRLKRLRKRKFTTTTQRSITTTPVIKLDNENHQKHQRKKKRKQKKRLTIKHKNEYPEPKNLILPMPPTKPRITRCSIKNGGCAHICNVKGPTKCECFKGFKLLEDSHRCSDINECLITNGGCQMNCTNSIGSYQCHCPHGFRLGRDTKTCEDVNECLLRNGHGPCQDTCINTNGGYKCSCKRLKGTVLANDLHSCVDVDECAIKNGGCSHFCLNTFGRSFCSCPVGMELSSDLKTCLDIDECNTEIQHECPYGCVNTVGSYKCVNIQQLQSDEAYKKITCTPLFPPENGYFKCSRKRALKSVTKSGRVRIKNSPGTKCSLVCPEGFIRSGKRYRLKCNYKGEWSGDMDAQCVRAELSE